MKELYELRDMLEGELQGYGSKGELSAGSLDIVDKLAHAIKNLDKIIDCDEGYSSNYPYMRGYDYENRTGMDGMSYARGRGRSAKRDSMGRYASMYGYSRHGDMADELRRLMEDAPNEQIKKEIQRLVEKVESM